MISIVGPHRKQTNHKQNHTAQKFYLTSSVYPGGRDTNFGAEAETEAVGETRRHIVEHARAVH